MSTAQDILVPTHAGIRTLADQDANKEVLEVLVKYYPGWAWYADMHSMAGVLYIKNPNLSTEKVYVIKLKLGMNLSREVIEAGGEILERYGQPRGPKNRDNSRSLDRDAKGNAYHVN